MVRIETFRGLVMGLIVGVTVGVGWVEPFLVEKISERVVEKMDPRPVQPPFIIQRVNPPLVKMNIIEPVQDLTTKILVEPLVVSKKEFECLARNIFFEAGVEDRDGKIAVGQVTIQRMQDKRWAQTICDVVHWPWAFSWTLDKSKRTEQPKGLLWDASKRAARAVLAGERIPSLMGALFYHADYLDAKKVSWASTEYMIAQVGTHVFYNNDRKK